VNQGQLVAFWIHDAGAKRMLGAAADHPRMGSRWVLVGEVVEPEPPIGVWMKVLKFQSSRPGPDRVTAADAESAPRWLIRWEDIALAQHLMDAQIPDDPRPIPGQYV
jgi:hypothetical protein